MSRYDFRSQRAPRRVEVKVEAVDARFPVVPLVALLGAASAMLAATTIGLGLAA